MARMAADDGTTVLACTPHMFPGLFENTGEDVRARVRALQSRLDEERIPLKLVTGADVHLKPGLAAELAEGRALTLADTRYFLLEPPHHIAPPRLRDSVFELMLQGYVPIITHPERLTWIQDHYNDFVELSRAGCWMQVTAGAITGRFGGAAKAFAERMLDDGLVDIVASDAHDVGPRKPGLSKSRALVAARLGEAEALAIYETRPQAILDNSAPELVERPVGRQSRGVRRWFSCGRKAS